MRDKVFYSIVGGLFAIVLAVFFLLVYPKMQAYGDVKKSLQSRVRSMEKYAKLPPEELPTAALLEKKQRFYDDWQRGITEAQQFYQSREDRIGRSIPTNRDLWEASYRDAFDLLEREYRRSTGLAADQPLPFPRMDNFEVGETVDFEKAWRVQKLIVEELIAGGGEVHSYTAPGFKERESARKEDVRPGFLVDRIVVKGKIPPRAMSDFLAHILGHDTLNLEIERLVVGKDPRLVVPDVHQEVAVGAEAPPEPPVLFSLDLNVLTWKPAPPQEPAEE